MPPKAIQDFVRRVAASRIGVHLAFIHFCLVVYGFAQKEPAELGGDGPFDITRHAGVIIISGRAFHWYMACAVSGTNAKSGHARPVQYRAPMLRVSIYLKSPCSKLIVR